MVIDIERLRRDLINDAAGAYFAGGFGGAGIEAAELEYASPEKLVEMARDKGVDLNRYRIG